MTKKVFIINTDTGKISKRNIVSESDLFWRISTETLPIWLSKDGSQRHDGCLPYRAFDTFDKASAVASDITGKQLTDKRNALEECLSIIDANNKMSVEIKCDSCLDTGKVAEDCEHCYGGNSTFEDDEATECDWCDGDGFTYAPCDHCGAGGLLEKTELSRNRL